MQRFSFACHSALLYFLASLPHFLHAHYQVNPGRWDSLVKLQLDQGRSGLRGPVRAEGMKKDLLLIKLETALREPEEKGTRGKEGSLSEQVLAGPEFVEVGSRGPEVWLEHWLSVGALLILVGPQSMAFVASALSPTLGEESTGQICTRAAWRPGWLASWQGSRQEGAWDAGCDALFPGALLHKQVSAELPPSEKGTGRL